jgi:hypothetical protein
MKLVLELSPDDEERLRHAARESRQSLEVFATNLLLKTRDEVLSTGTPRISLAEFEAAMDGLSAGTENVQPLPLPTLSRAAIYEDHD